MSVIVGMYFFGTLLEFISFASVLGEIWDLNVISWLRLQNLDFFGVMNGNTNQIRSGFS